MDAPENIIEKAIKENNEIIFTTSPQLLKTSLAIAVKYPNKRILNWLSDNVVGMIPQYEQLNENGKATVECAGIVF